MTDRKKRERRQENDSPQHKEQDRRVDSDSWTREDFFGDLKRATRRLDESEAEKK